MFIISSRQHIRESDRFGATDEFYAATFTLGGTVKLQSKTLASVKSKVRGKRNLLLIHGYNNDFDDVCRAYNEIERGISGIEHDYDNIIGYTWPGGDQAYEYLPARRRSSVAAGRIVDILGEFDAETIDVMTHSMGARVILRALSDQKTSGSDLIRNHFATASAVDDDSIEKGSRFFNSTQKCENSWVFHSKHDGVLKYWYRAGDLEPALGLHGPDDIQSLGRHSKNVKVINCRHHIKSHGDYKKTSEFYKFIEQVLGGTHPTSRQFFTL